MAALRKLWKKDRDTYCPFWRKLCDTWFEIAFSSCDKSLDYSSSEYQEWNPWKDWCRSWEEFEKSREKVPKAEREKKVFFADLYYVANLTRDKLEAQGKENQTLKNWNYRWNQKCEELQRTLEDEKKRVAENERSHRINLEKQVNLRIRLEAEKEYWRSQVDAEKQKMAENERSHRINLEEQVNLRKNLESQKKYWISHVDQQAEELQQVKAKCKELEENLSSFQSQLVKSCKSPRYQFIKNEIVISADKWKQPVLRPQLQNGEDEPTLDLDTIKDIVDRLGEVNSLNVFDWLYSCEVEQEIWNWSAKDFEQILRRCMDSSRFASLPTLVRTSYINWLSKCKCIAENFILGLENLMDTEKMREDDTVLQYFDRMWMIYRITMDSEYVSRNDPEYKDTICQGLPPHLYKVINYWRNTKYETLEEGGRLVMRLEEKKQNWRMKTRKAGAGCPPRMKIWNRLQNHPVPYDDIDEASYWTLLVQLSRHEDLETGQPR